MAGYMAVEPDELRRIAEQHHLAAAKLRKWGEIPQAWLADFKRAYGTIAEPMRTALVDYYDQRHDRAERLADNHERTRDQLLAAARALEEGDQAGGHEIVQAGGGDHGAPPGGPTHGGTPTAPLPERTQPDTPMANDIQPGQPPVTASPTSGIPDEPVRSDQVPVSPAASAPQIYDTLPTGAIASIGPTSPSGGGSEYGAADMPVTTAGDSSSATGATGSPSLVGGMTAPAATNPYMAAVASGAGAAARIPAPLAAGPFAAAMRTAEERRALPSFVVGEQVEDDLMLARTLLAAILDAVDDSALGLEWAVAVARTPAGPMVVLTSTEGRGWLPPGLFLPSEVTLLWQWSSLVGAAGREVFAALEGTADPARMLAEFGLMMVRRGPIVPSALVSSAAIPDGIRAAVGGNVAIEEWVSAAESAVDLTAPGVGLVDRLALAGSDELLSQAATVPDTEIRAKCLELARVADARVRSTAISGLDEATVTRRALRHRILDVLDTGQPVPANYWDQLRAADGMAAASHSTRVHVSLVPVGGVRTVTSDTEAVRAMVFERRADELLLLLAAGEPDRQTLRDALYAYGQIVEHPQFQATARRPEAAQGLKTVDAGTAVQNGQVAHNAGPSPAIVGSISVNSTVLGGPPPSIAGLLNRPAVSERSGEQRRV